MIPMEPHHNTELVEMPKRSRKDVDFKEEVEDTRQKKKKIMEKNGNHNIFSAELSVNCCGLRNPQTFQELYGLVKHEAPKVVFLNETRLNLKNL
jgi:hypothetical protein